VEREIPRKTIYRLSLYLRCLLRLRANEIETVSSEALSKAAGVKSTQLRKDLAYFGQFGTRGLGYSVATLTEVLTEVLGTAKLQPVILIGIGNLGSALLRYSGFQKEGFEIIGAFDAQPEVANQRNVPMKIRSSDELAQFIPAHQVKMAILSVPGPNAQDVVNELVQAGIQAILNFSPLLLEVPDSVTVNNVDLAMELENLSYFVR
jgi:redox-sensing transcriptional repressor